MARAQVGQDFRFVKGQTISGIGAGFIDDGNAISKVELHGFGHVTQSKLVATEVLQHRDGTVVPVGGGAHAGDHLGMLLQRSMGKVEPGHVHTCCDEPVERFRRPGLWADGGDNLCLPHWCTPRSCAACRFSIVLLRHYNNPPLSVIEQGPPIGGQSSQGRQ